MSKFNTKGTRATGTGFVVTESRASGRTYEGAPGYTRDIRSELFLLAVSNMVGEDTFYEKSSDRDKRYADLIRQNVMAHPEWTTRFLKWLRSDGNMRSASLVGALEAAKAMVDSGIPGSRQIVDSVLQRADEPGEAVGYWFGQYGRKLPKPVKRGIADAAARLYTEYALLKYDTESKGIRFADVIELVHPIPSATWQGGLFRYAIDRRHKRDNPVPAELKMIIANGLLREDRTGLSLLNLAAVKAAGMTWEDVLSLGGQTKQDKRKLWESVIPSMGYMALLRNLRNFDEAGVSDEVAEQVAKILSDPEQVKRSRQFPFRFLSAFEAAPSLRWGYALERALKLSLDNLPEMKGRSLILVDTSGSMTGGTISKHSKVTPLGAAAVFGVALAARQGSADLVGFADGVFTHTIPAGGSVLPEIKKMVQRQGSVGHGTNIAGAIQATYRGHNRVFIISDMQTAGYEPAGMLPANVPLYAFNLGGYKYGAVNTNHKLRYEFGGLTDATFRMIPLLEQGRNADWPF